MNQKPQAIQNTTDYQEQRYWVHGDMDHLYYQRGVSGKAC